MEFLPFLLFSTSFILFLIQILKARKRIPKVTNKTHKILPPGPWNLPIIGSIHHLIGSLPHHRLKHLSKIHGPIMHLKLGEVSTIVISSPKYAKEILKTYDSIFAQRPHQIGADIMCYGSTDIATAPYGSYWKQLRRICSQELLCTKRVRSFQSIREQEVSHLIKYISNNIGSCINVSEKVTCMTSAITSRAAFGKICKDQQEFLLLIKKLIKLAEGFIVVDLFPSQKWLHVISGMKPKLEELHKKFDNIIENIIKEAVEKSYDEGETVEGFLSVLLRIKDDDDALECPLTIDNIKAVILDMFVAGSDTSSAIIEWAISEMLKNPTVMIKAQQEVRQHFGTKGYIDETSLQELKYLKAIIKETLRLHPPFPLLLPRECRETCEINGYTILEGNKVIVNAWAIGRDPEYWTEAEMFFPERFLDSGIDYKGSNIEYIPFGAGRRICPGILFGVSSIELSLAELLYHFNWELPSGVTMENLEMTESLSSSSRRKTDLILVPVSCFNNVPAS
ncbi:desmethyl-deoxy-podophyllotoxin synthase-like [Vicia villosa]|uniref:desmethyl-deoxy-podophyllotoxin synthase-like n=1 Tax=Vicia villosa TaxID=3911 RepID=UPI00273A902C|nr:desmethyl-deoxy-podophyllotoxin synthase-like [Vicia villosa]